MKKVPRSEDTRKRIRELITQGTPGGEDPKSLFWSSWAFRGWLKRRWSLRYGICYGATIMSVAVARAGATATGKDVFQRPRGVRYGVPQVRGGDNYGYGIEVKDITQTEQEQRR